VYPGSFNPPTLAHLAIADAARTRCGLDLVELVLSRDALGKDPRDLVRVTDRAEVLARVAASRPWLAVRVTDDRLLADIARGADVLVCGADKWAQVLDPAWYGGSTAERDRAVASLPPVAVAPRPPEPVRSTPTAEVIVLDVHPDHHGVSATLVREGRREWLLDEAAAFDARTGAWSDPDRYAAWYATHPVGGPPRTGD
jgi:hypothetical protein